MFDIGWDEMLFTAIVAIVVIGPKELPRALRTAGRWIGKVRRVSGHFRAGIENMIREAEMEEMEQHWRNHNAAIMTAYPDAAEPAAMEPRRDAAPPPPATADEAVAQAAPATAEKAKPRRKPVAAKPAAAPALPVAGDAPELPLS